MEDDVSWNPSSPLDISTAFHGEERNGIESFNNERIDNDADTLGERFLMGAGYQLPSSSLFNSVAVGGTFDSLHYGHRKLLTLAVSAVVPTTGKLLIGITTDEMLQSKAYAEYIPKLNERVQGVRDFVDSLAPGMKNRVRIVPIRDKYGPPGVPSDSDVYTGIPNDFDALVLSHETLPTGQSLNEHRVTHLGLPPLTLLCTRRTEAHGMSSTALRRMKRLYDETSSATAIGSP
jgi:phosphopantetheine adenylyltransferase